MEKKARTNLFSLGLGSHTFPVAVDPVKEILDTSGSVQSASPTSLALDLEQGTTLYTPGGIPAWCASYRETETHGHKSSNWKKENRKKQVFNLNGTVKE